jgi:hypothetical protein
MHDVLPDLEDGTCSQRHCSERDIMFQDNHALKASINSHGAVIEKLIHLNTELMDAANFTKHLLEQRGDAASFIPVPSCNGATFASQLPPRPPNGSGEPFVECVKAMGKNCMHVYYRGALFRHPLFPFSRRRVVELTGTYP